MRRLWFGLMMLAPACLPSRGAAIDVIASSTAPQPVAAQTTAAPAPVAPISNWTPVDQARSPGVSLGRPRVVRGAAPSASDYIARPALEPIAQPQLTRVPASSDFQPRLMPEPATVPPPAEQSAPRADLDSLFAVERGGWINDAGVLPVGGLAGTAAPEKLNFAPRPVGAVSAIGAEDPEAYAAADGVFEEGYGDAPARSRFYGGVEYLMWWTSGEKVPVLATTSANPFDAGALVPGNTTQVLFGGDTLDHNLQSGARFRFGYWFDTCTPFALEGSYFFLGQRSASFATGFSDSLLARPFFDLNDGVQTSKVVAFPGKVTGRILIDAPSSLQGFEANGRMHLCCMDACWGSMKVDLLAGFRYLDLREGLSITEQGAELTPIRNPNGSLVQDVAFNVNDSFNTQNRFYGTQVGLATEWTRGKWSIEGRSTIAMGDTHQEIDITGASLFFNRDGTISHVPGGLLAQASNMGSHSRDRFSVVPEAGMTVGYHVTDWMKATIGYNCLVWTNVVRPGEQIDQGLDITKIPRFLGPGDPVPPPAARPGPIVPFKETTYWAQGLTLGLEFNY